MCINDHVDYISTLLADSFSPLENRIKPTIYTSKITTIENLKTLKNIASIWKKEIKIIYREHKHTNDNRLLRDIKKSGHVISDINNELKRIIKNKNTYSLLSTELRKILSNVSNNEKVSNILQSRAEPDLSKWNKKANKYTVYIAYDNKKTIHGIAIREVILGKHPSFVINHIVTNPNGLLDPAKKIKGIGTALVNHVVLDMKNSQKADNLYLYSLASSTGFYSKIGLTVSEDEMNENSDEDDVPVSSSGSDVESIDDDEIDNQKKMRLSQENVDSFIARSTSPLIDPISYEPDLNQQEEQKSP